MRREKKMIPVNPGKPEIAWHSMSSDEVVTSLGTNLDKGLSIDLAEKRLTEYGPNELAEKPRASFLALIFDQLKSFVIILLVVASIISAVLGEFVDAGVILTIVILNAVLGVVQESRAEEALAALKKMAAPDSQVMRNGKRETVSSPNLVPGDVVFLEAGNFIPADIRLIESMNLRVDEAALTGESVSVQKHALANVAEASGLGDRKNMAFRGTVVTYGRAKGVVAETGMSTELGKIAELLSAVDNEQTPLQKALDKLGRTLGWACLIVCAIVFTTGLLEGGDPLTLFMIAVSLAIAAVPEGLPAIVTISLALGMQEMVKRHALIRRLSSVETLGSTTVICSDKTGTLTQNEMTVTRVWVDGQSVGITGLGYAPEGKFTVNNQEIELGKFPAVRTALWVGTLNNDAILEKSEKDNGEVEYKMVGDPTEGSILVAALKAGAFSAELNKAYPRVDEVPFDSERKRMITIHHIADPQKDDLSPFLDKEHKNRHVIAVKGAPDLVLKLCTRYQPVNDSAAKVLDNAARDRIIAANDDMTKDALRVLGVAYRLVDDAPDEVSPDVLEKDLIFAGLIGMIDPARGEVKPALHNAARAGIRTIMITGDYPNTARAIAESIGLLRPHHKVMSGAELDEIDDKTLKKEVERTDVFARVSPEHKMRIVDALKNNGEVVAMTGDGVNDAPAIKRADIGISMGITGTDVAKGAADMVLTDDNYVSIVSAVEQGRIIYSNIRKFVYFLISCNMAEIFIIFLPTAFGWFFAKFVPALNGLSAEQLAPLTAIQLLWLNLITDGAPALALGTEKGDPDIMEQKPRPAKEPIINRQMLIGVVMQTIAIASVTLFAFFRGMSHDIAYAHTMAFVTLSLSELVRAFTARSERYPILKIGVFGNKWMNIAVLSSFVMVMAVIYIPFLNPIFQTVPLSLTEWYIILPLLLIPSVVAELTKLMVNVFTNKKNKQKEA